MNYYDELGISPQAPSEDVREAYLQLARLLHPDRLQDPKQRRLAELQMKRLNRIYDTLSNAEQRRAYDQSLVERQLPPQPLVFVADDQPYDQPRPRRRAGRFGLQWLVVAAAAGGLLGFIVARANSDEHAEDFVPAAREQPRLAVPSSHQAAASSHAGSSAGLEPIILNLRSRLHQAERDRDAALARLKAMGEKPPPATVLAAPPPPAEMPISPSLHPVAPVPEPAPVQASGSQVKGWSGRWYYVKKPAGMPPRNMYPPEFIEAALLEENGMVRGRYRARYKIADRAIPPEVDFQFAGKVNQGSLASTWLGPGGAKGEVRIRQLSSDTIELAWVATDLGRHQGLGYGTAVLVRRQEP